LLAIANRPRLLILDESNSLDHAAEQRSALDLAPSETK
jgi:hypothetical protein